MRFRSDRRMCVEKLEVYPFLRLKKFGPTLDTPTLPFFQNFSWACVQMDPLNVLAKFAAGSFSRS